MSYKQMRDHEKVAKELRDQRGSHDGANFYEWLRRKTEEDAARQREESIKKELLAEMTVVRHGITTLE